MCYTFERLCFAADMKNWLIFPLRSEEPRSLFWDSTTTLSVCFSVGSFA
jgi:hypothetical protein